MMSFRSRVAPGWRLAAVVAVLSLGSGLGVQALAGPSTTPAGTSWVTGLPPAPAAAALAPEPRLPVPSGWAFSDEFSRTAGTGRLIGGAFEWTDFVYDAFGAGIQGLPANTELTLGRGSYTYPSGAANGDGADIFRAAVGLTPSATIWRVDWNTLADASIPIAEWTFDTDNNPATGTSAWVAGANVSSPGIDEALVVSAKGAELIDAVTGRTIARYAAVVDMSARSFLVSIPRSVLAVSGTWRIRLAAGLADPTGTTFAVPTTTGGGSAAASAPRVYNITFRSAAQEPPIYSAAGQADSTLAAAGAAVQSLPVAGSYAYAAGAADGNVWNEADQADTLASGDVSKFSQEIDWSQLTAGVTTDPPVVYGWSMRWYTTRIDFGQGIASCSSTQPQLLGRVQPYALYVPTSYTGKSAVPLTWMLHSSGTNFSWAGSPRLSSELCQDRGSICASPEGFGPDGFYMGAAENDFWQVWRQVALAFNVDPNRTVVSGYSMGGEGSYILSASYPSDFSEALPLDGNFDNGCSTLPSNGPSNTVIAGSADRSANVHWVPMIVSNAYADELSFYPDIMVNVARYETDSNRFTLFSSTAGEHVAAAALDGFSAQVAALHGAPSATADPPTINYTWCPQIVDPTLGLGPSSVYWLSGLSQRSTTSDATSQIVATDHAIASPSETEQLSASVVAPPDTPPMQVLTGSWSPGATPQATAELDLNLTNVATLTIDAGSARLPTGSARVATDGAAALTLSHLRPGTPVTVSGQAGTFHVGPQGTVTLELPSGTATISWS